MLSRAPNILSRCRFVLAVLPTLSLAASGCQVNITDGNNNDDLTKEEARKLGGIDKDGKDLCAREGWYDDNVCDDFCVEPDPDCSVSHCPNPNDPAVTYHGRPGDAICTQFIDFCGDQGTMFNSADCGCGCIAHDQVKECGGFAGLTCDADEYCKYPADAMCGAADQIGTCQPRPQVCTEEYAPVCGCDGNTYDNACFAAAAGTSVTEIGLCGSGKTCGGIAGVACDEGEFCNLDFQCHIDDAQGTCEPIPQGCPDVWDPVCSCEGSTFSNACDAHAAGATIAYEGACTEPGSECGGFLGLVCEEGSFCKYAIEDHCGNADHTGKCVEIPQGCPDVWDPVCGCDGETYSNECDANAAGVSVFHHEPCHIEF